MKRRKRKTLSSTSLGVYLSLNIQVQRDEGLAQLITIPLLSLTTWLIWWWQISIVTDGLATNITDGILRIWDRVNLALLVLSIGWKSSLYGLGVPI